MRYEKPEITLVAPAIEAVQGSTMKTAFPTDHSGLSTSGAYEADE
jgi:hypothetical protein